MNIIQNPNVKIVTTLDDDSLQYPPTVYLERRQKCAVLVKFGKWGLI